MTKRKAAPKPPPTETAYLTPGAAAQHLAAQIEAASAQQAASAEDEPTEKVVFRIPANLMRGIEKLAADANRSRNYMAVQLMLAGFDGVLAALPADRRDLVLLATMTEEEE